MFTNRFAIVFLAMLVMMVTPATAQFGPTSQVFVFTPEVSSDGTVALRVYTTQCTQNYQLFFALSKAESDGRVWVDIPGIVPIGLEPLAPALSVRRNLNLKLSTGTYKLTPTNLSRYGNAGQNVDESKYCVSGLRDYAQTENIVFTVGQSAAAADVPVILTADQYTAMKERVVRFGALLPNATRVIFSQRTADGRVRYFNTDLPATPGDFQQISVELPKNFDGSLPVEVNAQDKSTFLSVSLEVLKPNPVVMSADVTTNR